MINEPEIVTKDRQKILSTFGDLVFVEDGHKYYRNGQELPSVSEITHRFKKEFDAKSVAEGYAKKNGQTPEYWLDQWRYNNLKATTTGTLVHEFGEGLFWLKLGMPEKLPASCQPKYDKEKGWLIPTRPKEEAIVKYHQENASDFPVLAETKVYNNIYGQSLKTNYCGTFDILYYRDNGVESGYVIKDYKTNKELISDYSRTHMKNCLPPFADLPDESLSMYTLQLSAYQIPLEELGLKVIAREIIWLKDTGDYELIPLPDFTDRLKTAL